VGAVGKQIAAHGRFVSANRGAMARAVVSLRCEWHAGASAISGFEQAESHRATGRGGISMKTLAGLALLLAGANMIGSSNYSPAQSASAGMAMPTKTLLLAQLDAKQVVGGSSSDATGTGAFVLDPGHHALTYSLTYQGLESGAAKSINLYNFGKGKEGKAVMMLCDSRTRPCPNTPSATISGSLERADDRALDNKLIGEFDSGRVYVEIVGGNQKPEIRGQLAPNSAMVPFANYVAHLSPLEGADSKGSGTAIVSETHLPDGKVSVFYAATVADTSGTPTNAALVSGPVPKGRAFTPRMALPQLEVRSSRDKATGGSISGHYDVNSAAPDALLVKGLLSTGNGQAGFVVTTSRFPEGELYGTLVPVR